MWPLQRVIKALMMIVGAGVGWFVATVEPKPRAMSCVDKTGMMEGTNFGMTKRGSERSSGYSHTLPFDDQEVQFNHPVSRSRLDVKELMSALRPNAKPSVPRSFYSTDWYAHDETSFPARFLPPSLPMDGRLRGRRMAQRSTVTPSDDVALRRECVCVLNAVDWKAAIPYSGQAASGRG